MTIGGVEQGASMRGAVHRYSVAITDYLSEDSAERAVLASIADLTLLQGNDEREVADRAAAVGADALIVFHTMQITDATLAKLGRCRLVVRGGVGFDNVDVEAAGRRGIVACNVPDYGSEEVADHALLMLLALARRLVPCHNGIVAGGWEPRWAFGTPRLRGKTLGLIGCGRIGTATALRAKAFGLRVVIYDPCQPAGYEKALGVERCYRLDELLAQSQFLSLHCPLTNETRNILNADTLGMLPPGASVINTARGACVDTDALLTALDAGQVGSAALDVVANEPTIEDRLRKHPRVVLSPHVAYYSVEGAHELRTKAAMEVRRALLGEPVMNPVNLHCLVNPRCVVPRVRSEQTRAMT